MATSLQTMKAKIRARLGGRSDKDSRISEWVDTAQIRILRLHPFGDTQGVTATFPLVAGTGVYNLSSVAANCANILNIRIPDERQVLDFKHWRLIDRNDPAQDEQSLPTQWYQANRLQFGVYPIPDAPYTATIRYTTWASLLTGESSVLAFDARMDDVVLWGALVEAYLELQRWQDAGAADVTFRRRLKEATLMDERQPDQTIVLGRFSVSELSRVRRLTDSGFVLGV